MKVNGKTAYLWEQKCANLTLSIGSLAQTNWISRSDYQIYTCHIAHPIQNHGGNRMEYAQTYGKVNILIRSFTNSITLMPQPLPSVLLWCSSFLLFILTHVVMPDETEADSLNLMQLPYITTINKASFYMHIVMLENCVSMSLNLQNYCLNKQATGILCIKCMVSDWRFELILTAHR